MPSELRLCFTIDGLPLTKSSKGQFWTILGRINLLHKPPLVVGCFYCDSKPKDANEFLRRFVDELKLLMTSGIVFGTLEIPVALHALICDAPAKAFALSLAGHTGYYSCTKCVVQGEYCQSRVCFPNLTAERRTDASFRSKMQQRHHTGHSILEELPMDMVKHVPLDYMHLVCLGVWCISCLYCGSEAPKK